MLKLVKAELAKTLGIEGDFDVSVPEIQAFGHYSTNIAMRLAKEKKMPPLILSQEFATKLKENKTFSHVEAVAPGFINLWLSEKFLQEEFKKVGKPQINLGEGKTVIMEYSSCNIAKPMHVGHLRSTVIGDAFANIFEYVGYKVVRWNYLGDWGTQFGKLIAAYKLWGDKAAVEKDPIGELVKLYVRFHEEITTNPELDKKGQLEFKKLEDSNKENRKLWEWFKDDSLIVFHKMFKRLGVKFDVEIGEAFYEDAIYDVLKELKEKELLIPSPEGGQIVNLDQFKLPVALIQKSDGASLYITRDIALLKHRLSKYKPVMIFNEVGNEQTLHFQQLYAIAQLLGLKSAKLEHIKHGLVLGPDGKKLSTREGKAVTFESIVDEITSRAYDVVSQKNAELSEKERREIAEAVGIGALKYNDLKEHRTSDIVFNWEKMLDFHGDSAPYLQYTVVRLLSIIKKAGVSQSTISTHSSENLAAVDDEMKTTIMKKVLDFDDIVALCAQTRFTSHLAKYLFELAKLGSQYYESVRILDDENISRRNGRLLLINSVAQTLTTGLGLLGIQVPERI